MGRLAAPRPWYLWCVRLRGLALVLSLPLLVAAAAGCKSSGSTTAPESGGEAAPPAFRDAVAARDPIALYEALERLIAEEKDSRDDRQYAYDQIAAWTGDDAAYDFARAAIAGRLAEKKGLQAGDLVAEVERHARRAREREPDFREGAATRLLGTLYVMAPPRMVEHGDSETGLEILEEEVKAHPDRVDGHLRLAEAYIALNDPEAAFPGLCAAVAGRDRLGAGEKRLLDRLVDEVGGEPALGCGAGG